MKTLTVLAAILVLAGVASAKDKDYQKGTVAIQVVKAGTWTDTTTCYGLSGDIHCAGGVSEDTGYIVTLTEEDGTQVHLGGQWSVLDVQKLADMCGGSCPVKYRVTTLNAVPVRILLDNGKELKFAQYKVKAEKAAAQPGLAN